jgi:hypothetical protein
VSKRHLVAVKSGVDRTVTREAYAAEIVKTREEWPSRGRRGRISFPRCRRPTQASRAIGLRCSDAQ